MQLRKLRFASHGRFSRGGAEAIPPERRAVPVRELISLALADPAFDRVRRFVEAAAVESWLEEDEKALLFGIGALAPGAGRVLEVGSWHGASACYIAAGIMRRGEGRLTCVDPHLGGPPWLGLGPARSTFARFSEVIRTVGVSGVIDSRLGESAAVAAVWPAEHLDAVFIDGDHSFTGALRDFECWAPKVRPGGLILVDDADDPALADLAEVLGLLKGVAGVSYLGIVGGFAAFRRQDVPAWFLLEDLGVRLAANDVHRSWDMAALRDIPLPSSFLRSRRWDDPGLDIAYELAFLARCGPGAYAYTPQSSANDRVLLDALSEDRGDGCVVEADPGSSFCRTVLCRPEEVGWVSPTVQPGGVVIAREDPAREPTRSLTVHNLLIQAGLDGAGWTQGTHWGVRRPHLLSADAIVEFAVTARTEPLARRAPH